MRHADNYLHVHLYLLLLSSSVLTLCHFIYFLSYVRIDNNNNNIIMSLFNEDNIFSKYTNLTYGPLKSKNTNST